MGAVVTASSSLFQPAVHSHKPAPRFAASLGRPVIRRRPARGFGGILSAAVVLRTAEAWAALPVSSRALRTALPGVVRLFGSLLRDLLGAIRPVASIACLASPIRLTGQS